MSGNYLWILITLIWSIISNLFGFFNIHEDYTTNDDDWVVQVDEVDKPAMVEARLEGDAEGYYITNSYGIDVISSDVVGMVGVPIVVDNYDASSDGEVVLVFVYDEDELACDEEDLGILYYNESDYWYDTMPNVDVDYTKNEVRVPVKDMGTYILEDMNTWAAVWNGTYDYPEPEVPECHWHNEFDYEDIERLADITIYDGSGEYHISTVEQLAGLVKLVNEGENFDGSYFYLEADLDLDAYKWAPIGWYYPANDGYTWQDYPFCGKFFGNGHAIYNMTIYAPEESNLGLFGRTLSNFEVHDLALVSCDIEGRFYVGGILGDNINPGEDFNMTNCYVSGSVRGQQDVGALVGSSAYLKIKDCYALMEHGSIMELTGSLRGGYTENCHINDEVAEEKLSIYGD